MGKDDNVKIWDFWLWEYRRRNQKYKDDFDRYMRFRNEHINSLAENGVLNEEFWNKTRIENDVLRIQVLKEEIIDNPGVPKSFKKKTIKAKRDLLLLLKIFTNSYGMLPHDYNEGLSSEVVLEMAASKNVDFFIKYSRKSYPVLVSKVLNKIGNILNISIDLSEPIEKIKLEVEKIYFDERSSNEDDQLFGKSDLVFDPWIKLRKIEINDSIKKGEKNRRIRADYLPRALGLYLYDNVGENIERDIANIVENKLQINHEFSKIKSKDDVSRLFKLFDNARRCISDIRIIQIP